MMYWIRLRPDWITVSDAEFGHVSKNIHRWTVDITDEDALEFKLLIESSGFASVTLDDTGRLPALVVTPTVTQAEPGDHSPIPSMSKRLGDMIAQFMEREPI